MNFHHGVHGEHGDGNENKLSNSIFFSVNSVISVVNSRFSQRFQTGNL